MFVVARRARSVWPSLTSDSELASAGRQLQGPVPRPVREHQGADVAQGAEG
jgi:hypothetical protein